MSVLTDNMPLRAGDHLTLTWNIYQTGTWYWNEMSVRVERELALDLRVRLVRYVYDKAKMRISYVVEILVSRPKNPVTLDQVTAMVTKAVTAGLYLDSRRGALNRAEPTQVVPGSTEEVKQPAGLLMSFRGWDLEPLDPDTPLNPGDRILIRFAWLAGGTYGRATQWAAVEEYLENYKEFRVVSYVNREKFLDAEIVVNQATMEEPQLQEASIITVVTVTAIATVIMAAAVKYFILDSSYRLLDKLDSSPAGKAVATGMSAMGIAVLIGVSIVAAAKLGLIK